MRKDQSISYIAVILMFGEYKQTIFLFLSLFINVSDAGWTQVGSQFPKGAERAQIAGIWNDSFFMIGGQPHGSQLLEYDMYTDELIDYGRAYFMAHGGGHVARANAQAYVQMNEKLYYLESRSWQSYSIEKLAVFNLKTRTYSAYSPDASMNGLWAHRSCLVSTSTHIVVIGGYIWPDILNQVWSFNIMDDNWDNLYKSMIVARWSFSCAFVPATDTIYAIGGHNEEWVSIVEKLVITNLENEWLLLKDGLPRRIVASRSLLYGNKIYIIGGLEVDTVYSLDTETDEINVETAMQMPFDAAHQGCAITKEPKSLQILCAGGGLEQHSTLNDKDFIIRYIAPTISPTDSPTYAPTVGPSGAPSNAPSVSPTLSPTAPPSSKAQLLKSFVDDETYVDEINIALYATLFGIPLICIGASVIIYKYDRIYGYVASFFFRVDNQAYLSVILYFVQMTDMTSDIYFVYQLWCYDHEMKHGHIVVRENVDDPTKKTIHILFLLSVAFTAIPYLLNFFSSIRIISSIASDDTINEYTKGYFKRNDKAYSVYTLLSGGSFYTLKLINSNFFGLRVFQAGMSQMMVEKYASHKIVLTTLLENVPQLVIQSAFVIKLRMVSKTVIVASLSSVFNILLSIMSAFIVKNTRKSEVEILFKINISWEKKKESDADVDVDPFAMTGRRKKLSKTLCDRDKSNVFEFEILSSQKKEKGATVYGVAKCDQKYQQKKEKIRLFFDNCLTNAVMEIFGYNDAEFADVFSFDLTYVVGQVREVSLSEKARKYIPIIWQHVDWNAVKADEKRINDDVIIDLTQEIKSLNGSNEVLEVAEEKEVNESDVEEIEIIIDSEMVSLKKND